MSKAIELLRQLRDIDKSAQERAVQLVMRSPSDELRWRADDLERKERLLNEIDEFLKIHEK